MKADKSNSEKSAEHTGRKRRASRSRLVLLIVVLIILAFILAYNSRATAPSTNNSGNSGKMSNLSLSPASQRVPLSSTLPIKIWAETGSQKVNAVQINLSYPIDKLNFVNVDGTNSAFGLSVEGKGENGKVTIARGSFQPVSGKLLVATVNFTGANSSGVAILHFGNGTALVSTTSHKNVLAGTYGGTYTLTQ